MHNSPTIRPCRRIQTRFCGFISLAIAFCILSFTLACDRTNSSTPIIPGVGVGGTDETGREEARLVRVRRLNSAALSTTDGGTLTYEDIVSLWASAPVETWSADKLGREVYTHCTVEQRFPTPTSSSRAPFAQTPTIDTSLLPERFMPATATSCSQAVALAHVSLCTAEALMEIANEVETFNSRKITVPGGTDVEHEFRVAPQSSVAKAAIIEVAVKFATLALTTSAENLRSGLDRYPTILGTRAGDAGSTNPDFNGVCTQDNLKVGDSIAPAFANGTSVRMSATLAMVFAQSADLVRESGLAAAAEHVSLGDAEFSANTSRELAARLAWTGKSYSRARGAHILVGGPLDSGLADVPNGYGVAGPLSSDGERATAFLRLARVWPSGGLSSADVSTVVSGVATQLTSRLSPGTPAITSYDLLGRIGLDEADWLAAKARVAEEVIAYAFDASLAPLDDTGRAFFLNAPDVLTESIALSRVRRTRDTATNVEVFDDRAVTAVEAFNGADPDAAARDGLPVGARYASRSVAHAIDYAASVVQDLRTQLNSSGTLNAALTLEDRTAINGIMGPASAMLLGERVSRVETCGTAASAFNILLRDAPGAAGEYRLVVSEAGLRCAVRGSNHGEPCTLSSYVVDAAPVAVTTVRAGVGYSKTSRWTITPTRRGGSTTTSVPFQPYYIVRSRDGAVAAGAEQAGAFSEFAVVGLRQNASTYCTYTPVVPAIDGVAARAVTPSSHLDTPLESCVGLPNEQRIPLEDELSEDGSGFESSWRHYLNLARSAAIEADRLGETTLEHGLEIERRVELASQQVETECGGPIGIDWLATAGAAPSHAICQMKAEEELVDGTNNMKFRCRNGVPVLDLAATLLNRAENDAGAAALAECVGDTGTQDYVTLGSQPLCLWENPTTGVACEKASVLGIQCPTFMPLVGTTAATCTSRFASVLTAANFGTNIPVARVVSETLNVYSNRVPDAPENSSNANLRIEPPLDDLRELRRAVALGQDHSAITERLRAHPWMTLSGLRALAMRVGWEGRPWDFSAITLDGIDWAATGNLNTPPGNGGWPCGQPLTPAAQCPANAGDSSLASTLSCSHAITCMDSGRNAQHLLSRVRMNHRMARAVLALRVLTGVGLETFTIPRIRVQKGDFGNDLFANRFALDDSMNLPSVFAPFHSTAFMAPHYQSTAVLTGTGVTYTDTTGNNESWSLVGSTMSVVTGNPIENNDEIADVPLDDPRWLWTQLRNSYANSDWRLCTDRCLRDPAGIDSGGIVCSSSNCGRVFADAAVTNDVETTFPYNTPVVFQRDGEAHIGSNASTTLIGVWAGVGGIAGGGGGDYVGLYGAIHSALGAPGDQILADTASLASLSDYWTLARNEDLRFAADGLTARDILDALELAAMFDVGDTAPACSPERMKYMAASSSADIAQMETFLSCTADAIETVAQRMILRDVPNDVVRIMRAGEGGETASRVGNRAAQAQNVASSLITSRNAQLAIVDQFRQLGFAASAARIALDRNHIARQRVAIATTRDVANQITECVSSISSAASADAIGGAGGVAAATCANAFVQIALATADMDKQIQDLGLSEEGDLNNFSATFQSASTRLGELSNDIEASQTAVQGQLTDMETSRQIALRALAQAMMYSSTTAGENVYINTVMRRRFSTSQARYIRALDHAKRMAFLARLSIEQRLGQRLSDMRRPMTLVEQPSTWVDSLCTLSGIDYERIRDGVSAQEDYSDGYIGDYVDKLERVVESYRLDSPFHEGSDVAVISLRDNILGVRDVCDGPVRTSNLLGHSGNLRGDSWSDLGSCVAMELPGGTTGVRDCVHVAEEPGVRVWGVVSESGAGGMLRDVPARSPSPELGQARFFRVSFGPSVNAGATSARGTSRYGQTVRLPVGRYMLSWYGGRANGTAGSVDGAESVRVAIDGVAQTLTRVSANVGVMSVGGGWPSRRHSVTFRVTRAADVEVAIVPSVDASFFNEGVLQQRVSTIVGGFSLVNLEPALRQDPMAQPSDILPPAFAATSAPGYSESGVPACEDTDGNIFREDWRYDCLSVCPDGFSRTCDPSEANRYCYWERSFAITHDMLEQRGGLERAGFAVGNYNYRTESIALNFVGTNTRQCDGNTLPSQCYGSGYLLYTLEHNGPYIVRNFEGNYYSAPLYLGRIEFTRGLAAERYLTNPVSSADRALIDPYTRNEFRGRPLTGSYVIRVWDTGDVNFNGIEDVQVLLGYRYWTRFR